MAVEGKKLLYIVVVDQNDEQGETNEGNSFRYTRSLLQSTLQLMGCKPRHAFKISKRVFEVIGGACLPGKTDITGLHTANGHMLKKAELYIENCLNNSEGAYLSTEDDRTENKPFELYKRRTTVVVTRKTFLDVISGALTEYKYVGPNQRADLVLACRIRERKESVTVLLCGTSGCGKSTLSALLGSRLGITTVISTDSIRHMMRSFVDETQNPLLWASTYHAGEYLDPVAVAEANAKRKAKKQARAPLSLPKDNEPELSADGKLLPEGSSRSADFISPKQMAIGGFKAQSEMVIDSLDRLITAWEERKESVVVEGVHLSLNFVMGLMKKHPSIIPFMVYISNEEKHLERFAVRAKYMTLDPAKNKYVKYIRNIRTIQEYLCNRADKHLVPKINNTNVDRSVAAIHATVFSSLRRREAGDQLYDPTTNTVSVVNEEYRNQCAANSLKSKGMFQLIQRKGSSRHLMALLNKDGSVAKAWPVDSTVNNGKHYSGNSSQNGLGIPMYGPLQIGKAEPVNLHFGHLGISAWPSDGGTSHASSWDDLKGDLTESGTRYCSSACSSPRISEGHSKELMEEQSVHGSDEEVDDSAESENDEDLSEDEQNHHEEMEGSVDEESTKSDEEYDDLAMEDIAENGNLFGDDRQTDDAAVPCLGNGPSSRLSGEKYKRNLDLFIRSKTESEQEKPQRSSSTVGRYKDERKVPSSRKVRIKRRSQSESGSWSYNPLIISPTILEEIPR